MRAKLHPREGARQKALEAYGVLDTPHEADFDDLVALAAEICGTPISLVSLVDGERQWFKAKVGVEIEETTLDRSICAHAILGQGHFEIGDATLDPRTVDNPLVTDEANLRFYAGVPLETPDGLPIGTLCVLDTRPRELSESQRNSLRILARQVMTQLELRRQARELEKQRAEEGRLRTVSEEATKFLALVTDRLPVRVAYVDQEYRYRFVNDAYERELGLTREAVLGLTITEVAGEAAFALTRPRLDRALRGELNEDELEVPYPSGSRHVRVVYCPDQNATGEVLGVVCHVQDVTAQHLAEQALHDAHRWQDQTLEKANVGTFDWDVLNDRVQGNPLLQLFFGVPKDAVGLPVRRYLESIHPEDLPETEAKISASIASGQPYEAQYRVTGRDGKVRWLLTRGDPTLAPDGSPLSLSGVALDVTERVESERALNAVQDRERARLGELLDKAPAFTALLEGPDFRFAYVNEDYRRLVGRRDILGLTIREALPEVAGQGYFEILEGVMATGEPFAGDELAVMLQRAPGGPLEERFVNLLYQAVTDANGKPNGVFAHGVDVTTQVLARKEIAERQELFRTVFEQAPDDAILTMELDRTIRAWNPAAERMTGWLASEIVGQPADVIFTPEDRAAGIPHQEISGAAERGKASDERWHVRKDGSRFWGSGTMNSLHDADGAVRGYLKVFRDATEIHRQTAALALHRRLSDAILDIRDPDRIVEASVNLLGEHFEASRVVYGELAEQTDVFEVRIEWTKDGSSLVGVHRATDFGSRIADNLRQGRIDIIRDREAEFNLDDGLPALRAAGVVAAVTVPALSEGRVVGVLAVNMTTPHDWTETEIGLIQQVADRLVAEIERARAEKALQEANELLEIRVQDRTQQLEAAVREAEGFNYSISHDLRTPLRAIVSTASIVLEEAGPELSQIHRELLERQSFNANRLGELIDELLRLSRLARVEVRRENLDLTAKARSVATALGTQKVEVEEGLTAKGDAGLVRTVLQNLLENACKFSPEGAPVWVGRIGDAIAVRDQGIGFDMKFAPKIFLPFERLVTEAEFPGTGIGLANVKRIVERHNGRVWVESAPGKGTTFFFTLE